MTNSLPLTEAQFFNTQICKNLNYNICNNKRGKMFLISKKIISKGQQIAEHRQNK